MSNTTGRLTTRTEGSHGIVQETTDEGSFVLNYHALPPEIVVEAEYDGGQGWQPVEQDGLRLTLPAGALTRIKATRHGKEATACQVTNGERASFFFDWTGGSDPDNMGVTVEAMEDDVKVEDDSTRPNFM